MLSQIRFIEIGDFVETLNKGRVQSSDSLFRDVESRIDALTVGPLTGCVRLSNHVLCVCQVEYCFCFL